MRSGAHPYNLSLGSALIHHLGEQKTEEWAKGLVANFARAPKGGDTDQIRAVAAGECGVSISNTYYIARLLRSEKPEDKKAMEKIGVVWPNQKSFGTHINISGGGMLKTAPHKEAAVKFLEYLASDEAQAYFANGNNEWPVVKSRQRQQSGARIARHLQGRQPQRRHSSRKTPRWRRRSSIAPAGGRQFVLQERRALESPGLFCHFGNDLKLARITFCLHGGVNATSLR